MADSQAVVSASSSSSSSSSSSGSASSTAAFFANLDSAFINIETDINQPYLWQTKDYLVQAQFELPIPTMAGSTVKYSFSTTGGDISFAARFLSHDHPVETIIENNRFASNVEPIKGSFKAPREGALVLIFDNTYSWFNSKLLSYHVELHQPAFTVADTARCLKSRSMLHTLVDDTRRAEMRLIKSQHSTVSLRKDISHLEEKLALLMSDLESKKNQLTSAFSESEEMSARIIINLEKRNGLCIRLLNKEMLSLMLSYLGGTKSSASSVCKYWLLCAKLHAKPRGEV